MKDWIPYASHGNSLLTNLFEEFLPLSTLTLNSEKHMTPTIGSEISLCVKT